MKTHARRALLLSLVLLAACRDDLTGPGPQPEAAAPARPLGVIEVEITGIGTSQMSATARFPAPFAGGPSFALSPLPNDGVTTDGSVQLAQLATGSFTVGSRAAGGYRYVFATFRVRNAQADGTAYSTPRSNLTFLGVSTAASLGGTAILALRRFDGASITDPALPAQILPSGLAHQDASAQLASSGPDVLQALTEGEAASFTRPSGVTSVFPYGFVVRRTGSSSTRALPASPAVSQFDGLVTFAFRVPLQASAPQDVYTLIFNALGVDDSETRLTQSLEEQDVTAWSDLEERAGRLGVTGVRVLPGGSVPGGTRLCTVRTAGTAAAPTAYLVNAPTALTSWSPDPYAAASSFLSPGSGFSATFDHAVSGASGTSFVVNGSLRGRYFLAGSFSGNGTTTVSSPAASFFAGEEVEASVTSRIAGLCEPAVARFRIAAGLASATFTEPPRHATDTSPISVALGDLNGDGVLDFVTANIDADNVTVALASGGGGFVPPACACAVPVGIAPSAVALGDLNGDGKLDAAVTNIISGDVTVLLGSGTGGFTEAPDSPVPVGFGPTALAIGDLNGDGRLDIAVVNSGQDDVTPLFGDGAGGFVGGCGCGVLVGVSPRAIAIGDVNRDGRMDLITANWGSDDVSVLAGDGQGGFIEVAGSPFDVDLGGAAAGGPASVVVTDLDGDGKLDMAVADERAHNLTFFKGNGAGGFASGVAVALPAGSAPNSLVAGDLNGDGKMDLAVVLGGPEQVDVLLGDGAGGFTPAAGSPFGTFDQPTAIAVGPIDANTTLDLLVADQFTDEVSVLLNGP
jgi:hypothetical protein